MSCETVVISKGGETPAASRGRGDVVIRANNLGKCYEIYAKPAHRLMQTLFQGRHRFYQEFWALQGVSFEVRRGETMGIIGRNGSGKSTLLQLLCGTLTPTTGSAEIHGRVAALLELGAGFNPEFTGRENVFLNARILGLSREQTEERFEKIAAFADIGQFIEQPVKTYSSGMYVRLAFAVIAHIDADILIIDEALAVGDVFFTQKCMRFLREFRENGTIIFVSHDSGAVVNLCHQALWLDRGSPRMLGPAKAVSETYFATFYQAQGSEAQVAEAGASAEAVAVEMAATSAVDETTAQQVAEPEEEKGHEFGRRGATISSVQFLLANPASPGLQSPVTTVIGGEMVTLVVQAQVHKQIPQAIVGFYIKDRLGQNLFGENTCKAYAARPVAVEPNQQLEARFTFRMPVLLPGDYTIDVSVAEGTQDRHVQHHWVRDFLAFKSVALTESTGLVGIPMESIELQARK